MTPVRLEYSESNPREFTLQWDKVYVPSNFTVLSYSIEITDESNKVLDTVRVTAASQETYEYSYMSGQSRSDLPECSRRIFSVFAVTDNGNTERVEVVWKQPKRKYLLRRRDGATCWSFGTILLLCLCFVINRT